MPVGVGADLRVSAIRAGPAYSCAVSTAGDVYCWGPGAFGQLGNGSTASRATPSPVAMPAR